MMANEPVGAVAYADEVMVNDFRPIPGLPETWRELQECLKEGEKEIERGEYVEWNDFVHFLGNCSILEQHQLIHQVQI